MRLAQGSSPCPKCGDGPATAATAKTIPIDGGGDQPREAAGDEEDDPEAREAEQADRGRRSSEKFANFGPGIYIA